MDQALHDSLQTAIYEAGKDKPGKGKTVKIIHGKHQGKTGIVFWHGRDRFDHSDRYFNTYQNWLHDAAGRIGYRIGVRTDTGEEFFTKAEYAEIINCIEAEK